MKINAPHCSTSNRSLNQRGVGAPSLTRRAGEKFHPGGKLGLMSEQLHLQKWVCVWLFNSSLSLFKPTTSSPAEKNGYASSIFEPLAMATFGQWTKGEPCARICSAVRNKLGRLNNDIIVTHFEMSAVPFWFEVRAFRNCQQRFQFIP